MPTDYYPIAQIESLQFRRKGRVGRGILIGAGAGFAAGFLIGYLTTERDSNCRFLCFSPETIGAAAGLVYGLPIGLLTGAIIGSTRIRIPIGGSQQRYEERRVELERFRLR